MGDPSLDGNCEKLLDEFSRTPQGFYFELRFDFRFQNSRSDEYPRPALPESFHQRAVVKLTDHSRPEFLSFEPALQARSYRRILAWNQQRGAVQACREFPFNALKNPGRGKETYAGSAQTMIICAHLHLGRDRCVANKQIQPIRGNFGK